MNIKRSSGSGVVGKKLFNVGDFQPIYYIFEGTEMMSSLRVRFLPTSQDSVVTQLTFYRQFYNHALTNIVFYLIIEYFITYCHLRRH